MNSKSWKKEKAILEKIAFNPTKTDFYSAIGGPFGAFSAPEGTRLATGVGAGAGMYGGHKLGRRLQEMMIQQRLKLPGRLRVFNPALNLVGRFGAPIAPYAVTGAGAVAGGRLGRGVANHRAAAADPFASMYHHQGWY